VGTIFLLVFWWLYLRSGVPTFPPWVTWSTGGEPHTIVFHVTRDGRPVSGVTLDTESTSGTTGEELTDESGSAVFRPGEGEVVYIYIDRRQISLRPVPPGEWVEITMRSQAPSAAQSSFLMPTLREQLDARQPLYQLARALPWATFEEAFADSYSEEGRPAKPVRLMVGLLLLKQLHNLGDETVVAQWVQNPYWQFFCGCEDFQWEPPCDPSDLVYFRQRIGENGVAVIFAASAQLHGRKAAEAEVVIDSTVQEKAVTYPTDTKLYRRVLAQKPRDTSKIYSLHEPHIYCIAKGKEHKKYEFGTKASLAMTKTSGILVAAVAHAENCYDGHTLPEVLEQAEVVQGERPDKAIVDRGYRGAREVGGTQILVPGKAPAGQSPSQRQAMRQRFRRRCAIEPTIAHLKSDFRLARNYLRGFAGDSLNLLLAAAAWNFRKWLRLWRLFFQLLILAPPHQPHHRLQTA
jgi:IS5 family transposase